MRRLFHFSFFIFHFSFFIFHSSSFAADLSFQASVDQTEVALGETLTLTLSISGKDLPSNLEPTLPTMDDFTLVGQRRSSSTNITIDLGGKMSAVKTVNLLYVLSPRHEGRSTIGAAQLSVGGTTYTTTSITIKVVTGGTSAPTPSPSPSRTRSPRTGDDLFVKVTADRQEVYVGQQVTLTYELHNRYQLAEVNYDRVPSFSGFWVETLFDAQHLNYDRRVIGGKAYDVALLKKLALFPTAEGSFTIDPLRLRCDVRVASSWGSLFEDFFGRTESVVVSSDPVQIRVLPLPTTGRPKNFIGGVGHFTMTASVKTPNAKQGDPLTVFVSISGKGNIATVGDPVLPDLRNFKVYDPKMTKTPQQMGGVIGGTKTFEYILIPLTAGRTRIGPFELSYFDPATQGYTTVRTQPIELSVAPNTSPPGRGGMTGLTREEIMLVGEDIRYIKPNTSSLQRGAPYLHQRLGLSLFFHFLPALALVGAGLYRRHLDRTKNDLAYARRRRAKGEAAKRLRRAQDLLEKHASPQEFHAEIQKALVQFLADKLNVPAAGIVVETVSDQLKQRGLPEEMIGDIEAIFQMCNEARFAPTSTPDGDLRAMYDRTELIINHLEKQL
ncbi:MAG: protein BatD [Candidatus Latescibacteria bacterium]|nr:protein BatD [Candidatus Latescibacterota bacterium]